MNEIAELLASYCDAMDAGDWDAVGDLFADGRLADEDGNAFAEGREAVAKIFRDRVILHDDSPRTKHLVMNPVFEPRNDDEVVVRSSYLVLQAANGPDLEPIVTGAYRDRFVRGPRGWRFAERRYRVDLAGDLSLHLRGS